MLIFIDTIHPLLPRNNTTTMLEQKVPIVHKVQVNKSETMFLFSSLKIERKILSGCKSGYWVQPLVI